MNERLISPSYEAAKLMCSADGNPFLVDPLDRPWVWIGQNSCDSVGLNIACCCQNKNYAYYSDEEYPSLSSTKIPIIVLRQVVCQTCFRRVTFWIGQCNICQKIYWGLNKIQKLMPDHEARIIKWQQIYSRRGFQ